MTLKLWKRPMKRASIEKLNPGESVASGGVVSGECPQCQRPLSVASASFTDKRTGERVTTYWPQCTGHDSTQFPDHGWGPQSPIREKSPGNPNWGKKRTGTPSNPAPYSATPAGPSGEPYGPETPTEPDEPESEPMTPKANDAAQSLASAIAGIMAQVGASGPEIEALKSRVETLEKKEGRIESIKIGDLPPVKLEGVTHSALIRLLKLHAAGIRTFLLVGPGGTGKTTLAQHFAKALDMVHFETSLQGQTAVERIEGFLGLDGSYNPTPIVESLKGRGVTVVDESFAGNPNTLVWFNAPSAAMRVHTPGGTFDRHPDNVLIFIDNTTGMGGDRTYTGRMKPDGATLDRFMTVFVDYDESVERAYTGCGDAMYAAAKDVRSKLAAAKSPRIVGMRWLKRLMVVEAVEGCASPEMTIGTLAGPMYEAWSADDKRAAGI